MITEDYVSFEVAKLLKEKGFNEKCRGSYHSEFDDNDNSIIMLEEWMAQPYNNAFKDETFLCSAPTHQMAMKWLREKGIFFCIHPDYPLSKNYIVEFYDNGVPSGFFGAYEKYEEAVEVALKYTLENFI